jgi:hypothetical protein
VFLVGIDDAKRTDLLADDVRFVCLGQGIHFYDDWIHGTSTGEDYWALVDEFIAARREGIVGRCCMISALLPGNPPVPFTLNFLEPLFSKLSLTHFPSLPLVGSAQCARFFGVMQLGKKHCSCFAYSS